MEAGLVAGGDMTPEAALSKLSYVLAKKDISFEAKKKVGFYFQKKYGFYFSFSFLITIQK